MLSKCITICEFGGGGVRDIKMMLGNQGSGGRPDLCSVSTSLSVIMCELGGGGGWTINIMLGSGRR